MTATGQREFDIILLGATGFSGSLAADHLAQIAPPGTAVALAGRNIEKLSAVREGLPQAAHLWPLIVVDATSEKSLRKMAERTRLVCTAIGPFTRYGEPVLAAAIAAGADYVDLTGEPTFVRLSIDKYELLAKASGSRVVHCCGFDSIPSDLSVYLLHQQAKKDGAGQLTSTSLVLDTVAGARPSQGSINSAIAIGEQAAGKIAREKMLNPYSLCQGPETPLPRRRDEVSDFAITAMSSLDPHRTGTLAPFFMSLINTRIVRRSNFLMNGAYGDSFRYSEYMYCGSSKIKSALLARITSLVLIVGFYALTLMPTRRVVAALLSKTSKSGSSLKRMEAGKYKTVTYSTTTSGRRYRAIVYGQGDPAYLVSARMLAVSALTLSTIAPPSEGGILTTAVAMGDDLINQLRRSGINIEIDCPSETA